MKDLVVYFSLEGNTQYVAEKIKEQIGADLLRLIPKKAYHEKGFAKYFWGGKSAVMAEKPELEDIVIDLDSYDRIIFGFPVWASNYAPPLRTFIQKINSWQKNHYIPTKRTQTLRISAIQKLKLLRISAFLTHSLMRISAFFYLFL